MARAAQGRLLRRLRSGLGLSGLAIATIGSGPCGSCPEPTIECASFEELEGWRTDYVAEADAQCLMGAAGQAGDAGQTCHQGYRLVKGWSRDDGCADVAVVRELDSQHGFMGHAREAVPDSTAGCCYEFTQECGEGRPFLVRGEARVAKLLGSRNADIDAFELALSDDWGRDALAEHASVAAFARLTLYLMAVGAPATLIEKSQRASLDELRHADLCFARASKHAGQAVAPGMLDLNHALDPIGFEELMFVNLMEGCIGESLAAVRVSEQARLTEDPVLTLALRRMSEDEAEHALLAFEILGWGLHVHPASTRRALERALHVGPPAASGVPDNWAQARVRRWNRAGRLTPIDKAEIDSGTWRLTVRPLLLELLHTPAPERSPRRRVHRHTV